MEWRQIDFASGAIRLAPGTTKNGCARTFPMTAALRTLLKARQAEHARLKWAGHLTPLVFWRMVAEGRRGPKKPQPITTFAGAWKAACIAAGCPGHIPHDLRRTAVRSVVRNGIPERVSMKLSGHKTASVFARYDIVGPGDLTDAARRLDAASDVKAGTQARAA